MRTLFFGGSFNPIHHGHLICSRVAAEAGGFDRVVLVPTPQPPHKPQSQELASAADRMQMCLLAVNGAPLFDVSDIELRRAGPSYTIDTARELKRQGHREVHWLIGADMLLYLPKWHEAEQLIREVHFVVMARPGWSLDWETMPTPFRSLEREVVSTPSIEISATDLRRRVAAGLPIEYLTPDPVCGYIRRHGLYQHHDQRV